LARFPDETTRVSGGVPKASRAPPCDDASSNEVHHKAQEGIEMTQDHDIFRHLTPIAEKRIRVARRLQAEEAKRVLIGLARSITEMLSSRLSVTTSGSVRRQ
jgi:hypothetical protein